MSKSEAILRATNRLHRIRELEGLVKDARVDLKKTPCWENGVALSMLLRERGRLIGDARGALRVVVDNSMVMDLVG